MDQNIETKLCKRCKALKAIAVFRLNQPKTKLKAICVDCEREMTKIYYQNNKDILKKVGKKYFDATKNEFIEYTEEYLKELKEKRSANIRAARKTWNLKNPHKVNEYERRTYMNMLNKKLAEEEAKKMKGEKE
jgi:hypothetical protein